MARYTHSSDAKGRIFIPAKLREHLRSAVFVTRSLDLGYLAVYTESQFESVRQQIYQLPGTNPAARRLRREIVGEAVRCQLDSQGRISISEELWQSIDVTAGEEICLIDMGDTLEICGKAFYERQRQAAQPINELDLSAYDVKGII
ncbi:MAG: division/cell wall cluster transcriptional repressor MraZ [Oscillospiraceae bacterium]|nr:division/cell wall cluster transcriptional repressor MraZ [Oscillospiraceae bacterium]